jgi:transcriptional antiterminator RfaH
MRAAGNAVARELLGYQIPFYLPLVKKTVVHRRRPIVVSIPLFAGYVFLYGSERDRYRALKTNRLSRILTVADPDQLWRDLRQLSRLIASGAPLTLESRLAPGDRVRVRRGPLVDLEGTVLSRRGQTRLVISVNFLQQGASVEIDDFLLEPLS